MKKYLPLFFICFALIIGGGLCFDSAQLIAGPADTTKYRTFQVLDFRLPATPIARSGYTVKNRRPSPGNIRDSVFTNHGFSWEVPADGGFLRVGHRHTDSARYYGWLFYYRWIYSAPEVRYYIFSKSAMKKNPNYFTLRGEIKTTTYFGNAGNSLTMQITALKTNIAASDLGITPPGLGDLVFNQASGPETILNGKTVREIVLLADSAVTLGKLQRVRYPLSLLTLLNTVVGRINAEFASSVIDTVSTNPLVIKGVKSVETVSYLEYDPTRLSPWNRNRTAVRMNRETAMEITGYKLQQNYPNPFNPTTTISYELPADSKVKLTIYDVAGKEVATLVDGFQSSGAQFNEWNASGFASGIYFYRLEATSLADVPTTIVQHKKMLLVK